MIIFAISILFCALIVVFDRCLIISEEAARMVEVARRYRPEPEQEESIESFVEDIEPQVITTRPVTHWPDDFAGNVPLRVKHLSHEGMDSYHTTQLYVRLAKTIFKCG